MKEDPVPDVEPDDELASAVVDGEAGTEELTRATEPGIAARISAFEHVARIVGTPVEPAPPAAVDAAIGAALAAFDRGETDEAAAAGNGREHVDELARRRDRGRAWVRWLPAAAVIAVLLGAGAVVVTAVGDDDGTPATANAPLADRPAPQGGPTGGGESDAAVLEERGDAGAEAGAPVVSSFSVFLGEFDDVDQLVDAVTTATATGGDGTQTSPGGSEGSVDSAAGCPLPPELSRTAVVYSGNATVADEPVSFVLTEDATGVRTLVVYDAGCDRIDQVVL